MELGRRAVLWGVLDRRHRGGGPPPSPGGAAPRAPVRCAPRPATARGAVRARRDLPGRVPGAAPGAAPAGRTAFLSSAGAGPGQRSDTADPARSPWLTKDAIVRAVKAERRRTLSPATPRSLALRHADGPSRLAGPGGR